MERTANKVSNQHTAHNNARPSGEFVKRGGEDYYLIRNVDKMPAFFISVVSDQDHWLFAGSQGGLTAGRVSPETALFPYDCVDKLYDTALSTGPRTCVKVIDGEHAIIWEPLNYQQDGIFQTTRNIYKHSLGNILVFEEINHDLALRFEYSWSFSDEFGICRHAKLENIGEMDREIDVLDGLQNILPAGTPRFTQTMSSNLVDAYKWNELDAETGLATFSLYSAISDRAEPAESLRASSVFSLDLSNNDETSESDTANLRNKPNQKLHINLCPNAFSAFKRNQASDTQTQTRGVRACYFVNKQQVLKSKADTSWLIVADLEQSQNDIAALSLGLSALGSSEQNINPYAIERSIKKGADKLARIIAAADGFQCTEEKTVSVHHYANTLFNVMRGGIFADQYNIQRDDLIVTLKHFNKSLFARISDKLKALSSTISLAQLNDFCDEIGDSQLKRLATEYLPITFGRRHGDPSRPWNQFAIVLKDDEGKPLLSYQGNWRDIFQNWEALALSFPAFAPSMVAKFVNASTMDGYNPYRITKQGIDWEVEEPEDPWSYIGYWGDHQIIYLLKLLEVSNKFFPESLKSMLYEPIFSYANVPYRIKTYEEICQDPKATVIYDTAAAHNIERHVLKLGADGKMILSSDGNVYQVNLLEKLLVPLLTKLSNLVLEGGIWLNTQRPEWNDANNALVGQGLSMVTLNYMHRYLRFFMAIINELKHSDLEQSVELTDELAIWLVKSAQQIEKSTEWLNKGNITNQQRKSLLDGLGQAACDYRRAIYQNQGDFTKKRVYIDDIYRLLNGSLKLIRHSIDANLNEKGMYHAYNILSLSKDKAKFSHLYSMLEGQVAALSSGALDAKQSLNVLNALFDSDIYREDIDTFMLYPDRQQTPFMQKNICKADAVQANPLLKCMLENGDRRIITQDIKGIYRFNDKLINAGVIIQLWPEISEGYPDKIDEHTLTHILALYEDTFNHSNFTGRSGGMFGFEGLGCVYWHMVSKLLLAVQEVAVSAHVHKVEEAQALKSFYYKIRRGIGFNKSPVYYGAFPTDPYSHTPKHAGAQQPGMTGQVKEEVITRFGELGCFVENGSVIFDPFLLREQEFTSNKMRFKYLDVNNDWRDLDLDENSLAFTWCQVPIVYELSNEVSAMSVKVTLLNGDTVNCEHARLSQSLSQDLFSRNGKIATIKLTLPHDVLFKDNSTKHS
uniref:hypothetical protein n=1 Tax=Ningiella ruwaisensis TaxID=2364274 RepID=UPI0010A04B67|nr:hypothetical protein [Ningiella ruwaisensis]